MKRVLIFLVVAVGAVFVGGLYHLFQLRYEAGDVYPEYSSLRADPVGTMALYEALGKVGEVSVERDYSAQNELPRARRTTYLHLAAERRDWSAMDPDLLREVQGFISAGGRLVVAFSGIAGPVLPPAAAAVRPPSKKKSAKGPQDDERLLRRSSPQKTLGFEFSRFPLPGVAAARPELLVTRQQDLPLPEELTWHSSLSFTNLGPAWRVIYAKGRFPVVIERNLGLGSIVMATDCYFLSNEALLKDRQPELLAWVIGPGKRVLFDEAHLGIVEQSGTAMLMRKYRLHVFGAALLLVAALFIWQNASPFPPALPQGPHAELLTGKEAASGFTNLLRRNVARGDLLRVCFDEWTKSLGFGHTCAIDRVDAAQAVVESENTRARTSRDPVRGYNEICAALKKRTDKHH